VVGDFLGHDDAKSSEEKDFQTDATPPEPVGEIAGPSSGNVQRICGSEARGSEARGFVSTLRRGRLTCEIFDLQA
jgi:hypothetical protein